MYKGTRQNEQSIQKNTLKTNGLYRKHTETNNLYKETRRNNLFRKNPRNKQYMHINTQK